MGTGTLAAAAATTVQKRIQKVDWQWEDDGRILLGRYGIQSLQVAQLKSGGRFCDNFGRLLQGAAGLLFSFRSNDLKRNDAGVAAGTYKRT